MEGPQTLNPDDPEIAVKRKSLLNRKYYLHDTDINGYEIWMPADVEADKARGFPSAQAAHDYASRTLIYGHRLKPCLQEPVMIGGSWGQVILRYCNLPMKSSGQGIRMTPSI